MRALLPGLLGLLALSATAATPDEYLARLGGEWDLTGQTLGKPVHYRVHGRWILADAWLAWSLTDTVRPPGYQAQVLFSYDARARDYVVHWLDQFGGAGARVVGTGHRDGDRLVFSFPYAEGEFRDTLELAADATRGTFLIESQAKDGSWSTFAAYQMRRRGPAPAR
ncbi:MAG: DUF1579 family protein [Gammaproteobacteria bacterium]|nr:DUF1579 family protein [Gammaproteobacteria bacterium]